MLIHGDPTTYEFTGMAVFVRWEVKPRDDSLSDTDDKKWCFDFAFSNNPFCHLVFLLCWRCFSDDSQPLSRVRIAAFGACKLYASYMHLG